MNERDKILNDTCVEGSYSTLEELNVVIRRIDEQQIMSCIFEGGWTEENILKFISKIEVYHSKLRDEYINLEIFSKSFNREYATDNNECFSTVERIFSEIRGTLKNSMRVFLKFTNRINIRKAFSVREREHIPAYRLSGLASQCRQHFLPFFSSDYVMPIVKQLCETLLNFFADMREVMRLCWRVIRQEAAIRANPTRCMQIFEECYKDVENFSKGFVNDLKNYKDYPINDPMVKELNETAETSDCIAKWFHKKNKSEFMTFVVQNKLYQARYQGISPKETLLWGDNLDKIHKVRLVIEHFDEMEPKGQFDKKSQRRKLSGKMMAQLVCWAIGDDGEKKTFTEYFEETYKGCYQVINYKTVNGAYSDLKKEDKLDINIKFENFYHKHRENKEKIA